VKKIIAGAALITTLLGTAPAAFAETAPTAVTAPATTDTTTTTTATDTTTAPAPATTTTTTSTTVEMPSAGITPDKFFYSLKLWIESIKVAITRDAAAKASILEQQAQTRLAEADAMAVAGKMDLAQQAMDEAKAKLEAAQKAIEAANAADKDISKLTAQVEADQAKFAVVLTELLAKAPEDVRAQLEPVVAELLVQVAATQDAATQDEEAKEEAEKVAEEAKVEASLESLQPRMVLVLNAMAKASGKSLADVLTMYQQNPGLGRIAKELGVKMGSVQHAAQIEWKVGKKDGKFEFDVTNLLTAQTQTAAQTQTDAQAPTAAQTTTATQAPTSTDAQTSTQAGRSIEVLGLKLNAKSDDRDEKDSDKGHGNAKETEHGKGHDNGKGNDKK
jgi:hypothetical protein